MPMNKLISKYSHNRLDKPYFLQENIFLCKLKEKISLKSTKNFTFGITMLTITFGFLLLPVMISMSTFDNPSNAFSIIHSVLAQTEENSSMPSNQTLKAQSNDAQRLPAQEGFSTGLLATNFTAPHNII